MAYRAGPKYKIFDRLLKQNVDIGTDWPKNVLHVDFGASTEVPCSAVVTKVAIFYALSISEDLEYAWECCIQGPEVPGMREYASGWAREEVEHECLGKGVKGKVFVALVAWEYLYLEDRSRDEDTENFRTGVERLGTLVKGAQMVSDTSQKMRTKADEDDSFKFNLRLRQKQEQCRHGNRKCSSGGSLKWYIQSYSW
jgi:hypothetical protein